MIKGFRAPASQEQSQASIDGRRLLYRWMEATVLEVVLKRFDNADETREFEKAKFELINIGGMTIGRAIYNAGWKWSAHVGKAVGKKKL